MAETEMFCFLEAGKLTKCQWAKVGAFMEQFDSYLDSLNEKSGIPVICGDFNFKANVPADKNAQSFIKLCDSKGFLQHIDKPTHVDGNTLDLVLTSSSSSSNIPLKNINIESGRCISDHFLLTFDLPVSLSTNNLKKKLEQVTYRDFSNFDIEGFRLDILNSDLSSSDFDSTDDAVKTYHDTLVNLLDKYAPYKTVTIKPQRSPWWNLRCQMARREKMRTFRKSKKKNHCDKDLKELYHEKCVNAAIIINQEREKYNTKQLSSLEVDPKSTY